MARIKLALCITELDAGGAERCLTELAVRLDRRRFDPVVYSLSPPPQRKETSCLPKLLDASVEVQFLGGRSWRQFPTVVRRLRRLLEEQKPQIIQTFLFHANFVGRIAARRAGVPRVASGIRVAERDSHWHLWLDRLTDRWVDRHVCVSRSVADYSAHRGRLPPEKLVVIPNGIDLEKYPAEKPADLREFGIPPGRRCVVFVGRLEEQKGVAWLMETAPLWLGRLSDCELLIVGDGPLRLLLEKTVKDVGTASDQVHFAGWRPNVPEILAAANLLVLPSRWEGMPNVVLEAMASRLPVVATDVEGVRELLGPVADQQTVRHGDSQLLAERIVRLMNDPQLATHIGHENRHRVEDQFDISRMVGAYESVWESLVEG
ncbi:MAG: glycosyltransferase [Pirellulales bacterium]|nr:glycosyltransferase [Pirellulales bacterium]